jgi:hypothetical protein
LSGACYIGVTLSTGQDFRYISFDRICTVALPLPCRRFPLPLFGGATTPPSSPWGRGYLPHSGGGGEGASGLAPAGLRAFLTRTGLLRYARNDVMPRPRSLRAAKRRGNPVPGSCSRFSSSSCRTCSGIDREDCPRPRSCLAKSKRVGAPDRPSASLRANGGGSRPLDKREQNVYAWCVR